MYVALMKFLSCCSKKKKKREIVLLLVGLDKAGKTTAAKGLAKQSINNVLPTAGFSTISLRHKGYDVIIFDLGGGPQIREIWPRYFSDIHGVIFVIDASDMERINECKRELEGLIRNDKISRKPILVLANKQDKPGALDEIDIIERLSLEPLINAQKCPTRVEMCSFLKKTDESVKMDPGLLNGYRWLLGVIIKQYKDLNERVQKDSVSEKKAREHNRELWRKKKGLVRGISSQKLNGSSSNKSIKDNTSINPVISSYMLPTYKEETSSLETVIQNGTVEVITHFPSHNPVIIEMPQVVPSTSEQIVQAQFERRISSSSTLPVREQLERKSFKQKQKSFSANSKQKKKALTITDQLEDAQLNRSSLFTIHTINVCPTQEPSPLPARTSPFMELPPVRPPGTSRPMTTRSLGRTGKAWDLDLPLEVACDNPETKDKSTNIF